ncbi:hypothetical protein FH608_000785 [Nonomuraea phyllanthi]|uniref:Uncharacterized protein n=1 Tax=Nonomuraea phyllanthi TaxID=2219224 RepID=A0A5C4WV67_9ACTN|nr:LxmA leader domain family RiPP [Nonomuraea phyllanthi]KAB8197141.1 hypothetical protein FH608_000785 [Nonomuraea phyllanthi]QFY06856.1 hypothetical protein GBF35_09255 [Nonomuraea phyllanthi]
MTTTDQLMAGYATYATPQEVGAAAAGEAPEISPISVAVLSFIGQSSYACGAGISMAVSFTIGKGC